MNQEYSTRLLDLLIENGRRILGAGFGLNYAEGSLFDVINFLRQEGDLKDHFLQRAKAAFALREPNGLEPGSVPTELIELVAHELRWPEFRELSQERVNKFFGGDLRLARGDLAAHVLDAYSDDWKDRIFYKRYAK